MAWKLNGNPETKRVTPTLAKQWADMEAVGVDRPLSEMRLHAYRKMLDSGGFRPVTWARVYVKEVKGWYRVNGKHTSTLFATAPYPAGFRARRRRGLRVRHPERRVALYSTFDSKTQTRTSSDINKQFASVIPELKDYDGRAINLLVGAISYNPSDSQTGSVAERAERLFDHVGLCQWVMYVLGRFQSGKGKYLWRVPVVAAMKATYAKNQRDAHTFWIAVRDETGEAPGLPDRVLAKWLTVMRVDSGARASTPKGFKTLPREFFVKCIHAWNAWRMEESTDLKYYPAAKVPAVR